MVSLHKKTVREEFADKFIKMLESDKPLSWTQGWSTGNSYQPPYNGESGRRYNGINRFILMLKSSSIMLMQPDPSGYVEK